MISSGVDSDGNGVLDSDEKAVERYVCNGAKPECCNTSLVILSEEPAGQECPAGGRKILAGTDLNGNGLLDENEILSEGSVCNGEDGRDGYNSLVSITDEEPGVHCASGGVRIDVGVDINGNGVIDRNGEVSGEADMELVASTYICNGIDGKDGYITLVTVSGEPEGETCPEGGVRIDVGIDTDRDMNLDSDEVTSSGFVCHGVDGLSSLIEVHDEPPGINCTDGGKRFITGVDANRNGLLEIGEITGTDYICNGKDGDEGKNALVSVSEEPPGENCPGGGRKIEVGQDANDNGELDRFEIVDSFYICNGTDGLNVVVRVKDLFPGESAPSEERR